MTDSKSHGPEESSLEGRIFRPASFSEVAEAIDLAFDYRGDVTLDLKTSGRVEGYVFNRDAHGPNPHLQLFPKQESCMREIPYSEIVAVAFTGQDTASGKSWEAWVAKKESQRRTETDQAASAARARGHL